MPDLGGLGVVAAWSAAAQVRLMGLAGGPGDEFAFMENRLENAEIVDLVSGAVDIVVENHIARPNLAVKIFDAGLQRGLEGEAEKGGVFGLLKHVPVCPVNARGKIPALGKNGRAGGVEEGEGHLLGNGAEASLEDGGENRVDGGFAHLRAASLVERKRARISSAADSGQMR